MRNVSDKSCKKNQNTHFVFSNFFPENRAVYEIMWENVVEQDRPQTTWRTRTACWIPKAIDTHLEYVVFIIFPLQQWLRERTLILYLYIHCMSCRRMLVADDPHDIDTRTLPCSVLQILNNCPNYLTHTTPHHALHTEKKTN